MSKKPRAPRHVFDRALACAEKRVAAALGKLCKTDRRFDEWCYGYERGIVDGLKRAKRLLKTKEDRLRELNAAKKRKTK